MDKQVYIDALKTIFFLIILTILNITMPILGIVAYLLWPIPLVYFILKHDSNKAMIVIIVVAILNTLIFTQLSDYSSGLLLGLYSIIGFGLIGFLLGTSLKEKFRPIKSLILTIFSVLFSNLIIIYTTPALLEFSYQEMFTEISENISQIPQFEDMSILIDEFFIILRTVYPALLTVSAIVMGTIIYYLTIYFIDKTDYKVKKYKSFKYWSFNPWLLSLGIIISLIFRENIVFSNILIVLLFLLFLQGLAVLIFYLKKINSTLLNILIGISFVFLLSIYFPLFAFIGLVDLWFNIRNYKTS